MTQSLPDRELGSAFSQPANSFNEFMQANSKNFSNFNTYPLDALVLRSATPVLEPKVFDENPANFRNFIDAFYARVSFNIPEPLRLFYPLRCTNGQAHSLVKGCQYIDDNLGYTKARELL